MLHSLSRRTFLGGGASASGAALLVLGPVRSSFAAGARDADDGFPRQELSAVEEVVTFSHFNLPRVKELVTARPALARASWDWGFGDWETPIGAASHKGRLDIAELLMEHGARPTLFTFAMAGDLEIVRRTIEAHPGIQRIQGPHGLTLMHHARVGGRRAESVVRYLEEVGDADVAGPDLPIPEDEQRQILGTYGYGPGQRDFVAVVAERGELRIKRPERVARRLVRVGAFEYHPAGVASVAVRFDVRDGKAQKVTIDDAARSIVGTRR